MRPALIPRVVGVLLLLTAECYFAVLIQRALSCAVYAVSLETVLAGHENWVYGIHWQPSFSNGIRTDMLQLILITPSVYSVKVHFLLFVSPCRWHSGTAVETAFCLYG